MITSVGHRTIHYIDPKVVEALLFDPTLLRQVLFNLSHHAESYHRDVPRNFRDRRVSCGSNG